MQRSFSDLLFAIGIAIGIAFVLTPGVSHATSKGSKSTPQKTPRPIVKPIPETEAVPEVKPEPAPRTGAWKGFSIGYVTSYVDYKEPGLMREYGKMYGFNVGYSTLNRSGNLLINAEAEFVAGKIIYDGSSKNLNTGVVTPFTANTNDYILNTRGSVGLYYELTPSWSWSPFIGIGYRVLNDKIDGVGSYNRNVTYLYLAVGAQVAGWFTERNSFSLSADVDVVPMGVVVSKLSDINPSNTDATNYNKGFGYRIVASIGHDFGRWSGHLQPFYQKWKLDESDHLSATINGQSGYLAEPANESDLIGLNIGVDF